jgi:hypothetical protein
MAVTLVVVAIETKLQNVFVGFSITPHTMKVLPNQSRDYRRYIQDGDLHSGSDRSRFVIDRDRNETTKFLLGFQARLTQLTRFRISPMKTDTTFSKMAASKPEVGWKETPAPDNTVHCEQLTNLRLQNTFPVTL